MNNGQSVSSAKYQDQEIKVMALNAKYCKAWVVYSKHDGPPGSVLVWSSKVLILMAWTSIYIPPSSACDRDSH